MLRPRNQFYEVRRPPPPTITISSLLEFGVHFEPDKREEESLMPFRFARTIQPSFSFALCSTCKRKERQAGDTCTTILLVYSRLRERGEPFGPTFFSLSIFLSFLLYPFSGQTEQLSSSVTCCPATGLALPSPLSSISYVPTLDPHAMRDRETRDKTNHPAKIKYKSSSKGLKKEVIVLLLCFLL